MAIKKLEGKAKPIGREGKEWHLVSPDGTHYEFYDLSKWASENCQLFGFEKSRENALKIKAGISQAKGATIGTNLKASKQYKGWKVITD